MRTIRPKQLWGFQELRPHISYTGYWDFDGFQETGCLHVDNHWEWKSGYEIHTGVNFTTEGLTEPFEIFEDIVVHDETNASLAWMLTDLPGVVALGVLYRQPGPVYNESAATQREMAEQRFGEPDLNALLRQGHTWTVS